MALRVTFSSAAYDDDETFAVEDSQPVRRAIELRRQLEDFSGDGHSEIRETRVATHTESEFVEWVLQDIGTATYYYDEQADYVWGRRDDPPLIYGDEEGS